MIPTIETIAEDLASDSISISQAITWLHQHAEGSANELRDHFAGLAMQGIVTRPPSGAHQRDIAEAAYMLADAMLAERVKK
jgi:hypothetical protein